MIGQGLFLIIVIGAAYGQDGIRLQKTTVLIHYIYLIIFNMSLQLL